MAYVCFFLPQYIYYPQPVISQLNTHGELSTVITLRKEPLLLKCPESVYIERITPEGSLKPIDFFLEQIEKNRSKFVVLDHCFWDDDTQLLTQLLDIQKKMNFILVNLLHTDEYKFQNMKLVDRYYWPEWKAEQIWSWYFLLTDKKCFFYKYLELDPIEGETIDLQSPQHSMELHKQVFVFIRLLNTIHLRNELDLFVLFLGQLKKINPDPYLYRLRIEFNRFFRYRDDLKNNKQITPDILNDLNETINKHVLYLAAKNNPLFEEMCRFFMDSPKLKME